MPALPNFFLAGAAKCGTTSLYHYLDQHPDIYMSPVKEPSFFGAEDIRRYNLPQVARLLERQKQYLDDYLDGPMDHRLRPALVLEWDRYLKLFKKVRGEHAIGEASVNYFGFPGAAGAIHARIPGARIVLALRHPAERMFSLYASSLNQDASKTLRERFRGAREGTDVWSIILDDAKYATNLRRFFGYFTRERVKVFLYDDLQQDPRGVLRDMFIFLGVDPEFPVDLSQRHNQSWVPKYPRLHALRRAFARSVPLLERLPSPVRTLARRLYHRPRSQLRMNPEDRAFIVDFYREETIETGKLIGRDLSAWLR